LSLYIATKYAYPAKTLEIRKTPQGEYEIRKGRLSELTPAVQMVEAIVKAITAIYNPKG
jgi:hypothetical protein